MKKLILIITGLLILVFPATILASGPEGIVAHVIGTVKVDPPDGSGCVGDDCAGDLVTCQEGEFLTTVSVTFLFLEDVCDDGGATPCNERLSLVDETCGDPSTDVNLSGLILSVTPQGRFRICFDDPGPSLCTGSPPSGTIIGEGVVRSQVRQFLGSGPAMGNVELDLTKRRSFRIDGQKLRLTTDVSVGDFTSQPDANQDNCGGDGCGITATIVSWEGQGEKGKEKRRKGR